MSQFSPRVFSGMQPTGNLHLGNYLGAMVNWIKMQATHETIYCVVDMHAITVHQEPKALRIAIRDVTAAYLANRIAGSPAMNRGRGPIPTLQHNQVIELQTLLNKRGFPVGEPDGKLGAGTRGAVKAAQIKHSLPADSYPTVELIEKLRR